jgi:hypothetical protein
MLDDHIEACDAVREAHGCFAAHEALMAADEVRDEIEGEINNTPAEHVTGLLIKMEIMAHWFYEKDKWTLWHDRFLMVQADAERLAAAASTAHQRRPA